VKIVLEGVIGLHLDMFVGLDRVVCDNTPSSLSLSLSSSSSLLVEETRTTPSSLSLSLSSLSLSATFFNREGGGPPINPARFIFAPLPPASLPTPLPPLDCELVEGEGVERVEGFEGVEQEGEGRGGEGDEICF